MERRQCSVRDVLRAFKALTAEQQNAVVELIEGLAKAGPTEASNDSRTSNVVPFNNPALRS